MIFTIGTIKTKTFIKKPHNIDDLKYRIKFGYCEESPKMSSITF